MSEIKKRVIRIGVLILTIIISFLLYLYSIDGLLSIRGKTYREIGKDNFDTLFIGSSHMYIGVNPVQLYEDIGMGSYIWGGGSRAVWESYYYIKEALQNDKEIKNIFLDVYTSQADADKFTEKSAIANLYDFPLGKNKIDALNTTEIKKKASVFWIFPYTHQNYRLLNKIGSPVVNYEMGYSHRFTIEEYTPDMVINSKEVEGENAIIKKSEEYLRLAIEECQEKGINIVLINTPCPINKPERQKKSNYIMSIAREYGVPYIDGNLYIDEVGIDWRIDSSGTSHLNHAGVTKFTAWLEGWITENIEYKDYSGNERWEYAIEQYHNNFDESITDFSKKIEGGNK